MNKDAEKRIAAQLAKAMAMICVRNTMLEDLHAGPGPVTRTGDYSEIDRWMTVAGEWDEPELVPGMTRSLDKPGN